MGIHGLTSFIDNNPHMLKDRQLHDCKIVIDGNNFYHFLYSYCNVRFQFGGDYDIYQRKISMIFNLFKSCGIEVFVVFDGAYTVDGKKFKTTIGRARDRMYAAKRVMYGHRGGLIPCLARQTFTQTLDKLGIKHVTCDFEADNQLVTLANQWNCPVVSNDSDFYIFDLSGGFIPLDYIDFRLRQLTESAGSSGAFLLVQYYHVDGFIKGFKSLNRAVLPLFATMLGNDYVNAAAFEAFYRKKTPKVAARLYSASKKHLKIVSVLYWLEEKEHKGELVSEVLTFIRPEQQQRVKKLLTDSISGYTDTQDFESFSLKQFLEGDRLAAAQKTELVTSSSGESLPEWLVAACRRGEIPVSLLNVALLHRIILQIQVEEISFQASSETSKTLREVLYGLLFRRDQMEAIETEQNATKEQLSDASGVKKMSVCEEHVSTCSSNAGSDNHGGKSQEPSSRDGPENGASDSVSLKTPEATQSDGGVVEYTRNKLELWRITVEPRTTLPNFGQIPTLEQISVLGEEERLDILLETLGVSAGFAAKFDPDFQLYVACLVFWARNATTSVTLHHLKGIILSAVLLHIQRELASRENGKDKACDGEKGLGKHCIQPGDQEKCTASPKTSKTPDSQGDAETHSCSGEENLSVSHTGQHSEYTPNDNPPFSISSVCCSAEGELLEIVRNNLNKYYHNPAKICSKNQPDKESFHRTAQFQYTLLDAVQLNCLLRCPVLTTQPASLFNGSFIYTIIQELQSRSNPDLFLSEMLVKGSAFSALFNSLCSEIVTEAGESVFAERKSQGSKCCKGKKKKKKKAKESESHGKELSDRISKGEAGQGEDAVVAFCDLSNRFGVLMMEEGS
ncbi:single-strand DNA endonuclease ASTE1-like [Littorina saxatilis]|uniref:Uncharacterized protein n=1 Tax=Littorina saxatilis TaxID=31220 RepID=A0AAN9C0Q5_9CAEN